MPTQRGPSRIVVKIDDLFFLNRDIYHSISHFVQVADTYFGSTVQNRVRVLFSGIDDTGSKAVYEGVRVFLKDNGLLMKSLFFDIENDSVAGLMADAFEFGRYKGENLLNFFVVEVPPVNVENFVKLFNSIWGVAYSYMKGEVSVPAPRPPSSPSRIRPDAIRTFMKRFNTQPTGKIASATRLVDLEQGWDSNKVTGPIAAPSLLPPMLGAGINFTWKEHGANTVNILRGSNTSLDLLQGLATDVTVYTASIWRYVTKDDGTRVIRERTESSLTEIFQSILIKPGDIVLLELQTSKTDRMGYMPIESEPAILHIITCAVRKGIVVIEAAGNGKEDLGDLIKATFLNLSPRYTPQFNIEEMKNNGAIMVGAIGAGPNSHNKSNFGERIDCYCYGEPIHTFWSSTFVYLEFSESSLASAIVASLAAKMQMAAKSKGRTLKPQEIRNFLRSDENSPSNATAFNDFIARLR